MTTPYTFCPSCRSTLDHNDAGYLACPSCSFVHWDNPVPVAAAVIPMMHTWLSRAGMPTEDIIDGGLVHVQRDRVPFPGEFCLPCGHIEKHGHPKAELVREVEEETGLVVRIEKLLCICNPMPGEVNQLVISYLCRPVGGRLIAGSDARSVGVFGPDAPLCFRSHRMLQEQWFAGNLGTLTGIDLLV